MDDILISSWKKVMDGKSADHVHALLSYLAKYKDLLFRREKFVLPELTGQALKDLCIASHKSASGMDGWGTDDLALLPIEFFDWLAYMLRDIESGSPWPAALLHHRASCLSKNPSKPHDPLEYRVLKVMPVVYRRWAGVRLRHLAPWVATWQLDCMFAGVADRAADDAWYLTGLEVEMANLDHICLVGGAVDLFKCFDQLMRLIIYIVLMIAGMPDEILTPYINYHENTHSYFFVHGCVGQPHRFKCGIPQGCPLSMMIVALLMRAWMLQIARLGAIPRALADDLLLLTTGANASVVSQSPFKPPFIIYTTWVGRSLAPNQPCFRLMAKCEHG